MNIIANTQPLTLPIEHFQLLKYLSKNAFRDKFTIDMNYSNVEYKVKLPDDYEEQFSKMTDYDRWMVAVSAYEKSNQLTPNHSLKLADN